jgi:hypothetical protein
MITDEQQREILSRAYVPEHVVGLMTRVSGGEPFLIEDYLCVGVQDLVIVVGYPLERDFHVDQLEKIVERAVETFRPARLSVVAAELPSSLCASCRERESDYYFTLNLDGKRMRSALQKSVMKAMELAIVEHANGLGQAHQELASEFVDRVDPPPRVRELLFRMWDYVGQSDDSLVLNAWRPGGELAAFYVLDLSAKDFSTYIIGCHSKKNYVQGVSDLLFHEMMNVSKECNKKYIHLGLGVNRGISQFKKKWGGKPSIKYEMCELMVRKPSLIDAIFSHARKR